MLSVRNYKLVSDQIDYDELEVIVREADRVLDNHVSGHFIELGCYTGTTSLFLQRLIDSHNSDVQLHVYDSFEGLPHKLPQDHSPVGEQFIKGKLTAKKSDLIKNFKQAGLKIPYVHKLWFEDMKSDDLPSQISFAFLDGDFYSSIESSLRTITPLLSEGSVVVVDDYHTEALPGAKNAVDTWAQKYNQKVRIEQSLAVIHWRI